jgi:hypothetical protein
LDIEEIRGQYVKFKKYSKYSALPEHIWRTISTTVEINAYKITLLTIP